MIIAMAMMITGRPTIQRLTIACDIVCSLDLSEDIYLNGKDDCDYCYGYDDLKSCHTVLLVAMYVLYKVLPTLSTPDYIKD